MFNEFVRNPLADPVKDLADMYLDTTELDPTTLSVKVPPYQPPEKSDQGLEELAKDLCQQHSVSLLLLRSISKDRALTPIRAELARTAIKSGIGSRSEVAQFLGRQPSAVTQWLERYTDRSRPDILLD